MQEKLKMILVPRQVLAANTRAGLAPRREGGVTSVFRAGIADRVPE